MRAALLLAFGVAAFSVVSLLAPGRAHAADSPVTTEAVATPRVLLLVAGSTQDVATLDSSLRELLQRMGVRLEVRKAMRLDTESSEFLREQPVPLAVVWLDLSDPSNAAVTIAQPAAESERVRRSVGGETPALAIEASAHVVQSVVEELLRTPAPAPAPAPSAPAPPAPAPEPPATTPNPRADRPSKTLRLSPASRSTDLAMDFGGFLGGRAFGGGSNVVVGGGISAQLVRGRTGLRPGLLCSGEYHVPFEVTDSLVQLRAHVLSLRLAPTVVVLSGSSWLLEAGAGGGVDTFFTSMRSSDLPTSSLRQDRSDSSPVLTALVSGHLAVAQSADLVLSFVLDEDLAPRHYVADRTGEHVPVFSPSRLRPALLFGFTFGTFGPDPYETRVARAP